MGVYSDLIIIIVRRLRSRRGTQISKDQMEKNKEDSMGNEMKSGVI